MAASLRPGCGAAGCVRHRSRVGIDGEDEAPRVGGRRGECRAPVTCPEVDVDPPVLAGKGRDLADVCLVRAAADDRAHGGDGATRSVGGSLTRALATLLS